MFSPRSPRTGTRRRAARALVVATALAALTAPTAGTATPAAAAETSTLTVYVTTAGSDSNDGLSKSDAVRTLGRAQRILKSIRGNEDALVCMGTGTFTTQGISWKHFRAPYRTTVKGRCLAQTGTTVLHGRGADRVLGLNSGNRPTRFELRDVVVTDAANGIGLVTADGVTLTNVTFRRIGEPYGTGKGYSALGLNDADYTLVRGSRFVDVRNTSRSTRHLIHAVYASWGSSRNRIVNTTFDRVSGDPVKFRDHSSTNVLDNVTFTRSGERASYQDGFDRSGGEGASWGNRIVRSTMSKRGFSGQAIARTVCFDRRSHVCPTSRVTVVP